MKKDLLTLSDLSSTDIYKIIHRASFFKKTRSLSENILDGKILGLIFEKESTRTRISFEVAMMRLGGQTVYLGQNSSQISRGETYSDTARVLSRYLDILVVRTFAQQNVVEIARNASIPVINGLTDMFHPCQILADLMTIQEKKGNLEKLKIVYVGDGNNMANTWLEAAQILGLNLNICCPKKYMPYQGLLDTLNRFRNITIHDIPTEAVKSCDVINTDTWFSMGEKASEIKKKAFKKFQISESLLQYANSEAIVLHCLPAHRGEEITAGVLDGPRSVVFDQAENRLYVQMALLESLFQTRSEI